jgi:hypothetical protein
VSNVSNQNNGRAVSCIERVSKSYCGPDRGNVVVSPTTLDVVLEVSAYRNKILPTKSNPVKHRAADAKESSVRQAHPPTDLLRHTPSEPHFVGLVPTAFGCVARILAVNSGLEL